MGQGIRRVNFLIKKSRCLIIDCCIWRAHFTAGYGNQGSFFVAEELWRAHFWDKKDRNIGGLTAGPKKSGY